MEYYMPSEIARLVLGYLKEINCTGTADLFLVECSHLQEYSECLRNGHQYPTNIGGKSLKVILRDYCYLKDAANSVSRQQNQRQPDLKINVSSNTHDERACSPIFLVEGNVFSNFSGGKERCSQDATNSITQPNQSVILEKKHQSEVKINEIAYKCEDRACSPIFSADKDGNGINNLKFPKRKNSPSKRRKGLMTSSKAKNCDNDENISDEGEESIDLTVLLEQLYKNTSLHEKIAENINKAVSVTSQQNLQDKIVKEAVDQTESDPLFDELLNNYFDNTKGDEVISPYYLPHSEQNSGVPSTNLPNNNNSETRKTDTLNSSLNHGETLPSTRTLTPISTHIFASTSNHSSSSRSCHSATPNSVQTVNNNNPTERRKTDALNSSLGHTETSALTRTLTPIATHTFPSSSNHSVSSLSCHSPTPNSVHATTPNPIQTVATISIPPDDVPAPCSVVEVSSSETPTEPEIVEVETPADRNADQVETPSQQQVLLTSAPAEQTVEKVENVAKKLNAQNLCFPTSSNHILLKTPAKNTQYLQVITISPSQTEWPTLSNMNLVVTSPYNDLLKQVETYHPLKECVKKTRPIRAKPVKTQSSEIHKGALPNRVDVHVVRDLNFKGDGGVDSDKVTKTKNCTNVTLSPELKSLVNSVQTIKDNNCQKGGHIRVLEFATPAKMENQEKSVGETCKDKSINEIVKTLSCNSVTQPSLLVQKRKNIDIATTNKRFKKISPKKNMLSKMNVDNFLSKLNYTE